MEIREIKGETKEEVKEEKKEIKEEQVKEEQKDADLKLKAALEKDNQVLQAMQLLKSWNVISQIKAGL
jgi:hypothetical protein